MSTSETIKENIKSALNKANIPIWNVEYTPHKNFVNIDLLLDRKNSTISFIEMSIIRDLMNSNDIKAFVHKDEFKRKQKILVSITTYKDWIEKRFS